MINAKVFINSVEKVSMEVENQIGGKVMHHEVRKVMKNDFNMKFKKLKHVALHTNSVNNLILRQQFSLKFLECALQGKVLMNLDESWIDRGDFRRRNWQLKDQHSSSSIAI